jgi:uncharacterized protein YkwD
MLDAAAPRLPRRIVRRTLAFGVSALVAAGLLTWSPAATSGWNQGSAEATLWQLLNGARANNGLAAVQSNGTLVALARWRSDDMLAKDYFSHTIAGCGCLVYTYYDSNGLSYQWAGENIGWNSGLDDSYSPVRVHEAFMASAGHRANVLDGRFTHAGVGAAARDGAMFQGYVQNTRMYAELFMQSGSVSAPAPAPAPRPPSGSTAPRTATTTRTTTRATAPAAEPKPKQVEMAAPRRPVSTAGLDGVATIVSAPGSARMAAHLRADEIAATRLASLPASEKVPTAIMTRGHMEVSAASTAPVGLLDGFFGAVLGFLFG